MKETLYFKESKYKTINRATLTIKFLIISTPAGERHPIFNLRIEIPFFIFIIPYKISTPIGVYTSETL